MNDVLVITGPTASGKTAVSVKLATEVGGEIVNADSMQIYSMCNIGSAKATKKEQCGILHHMIDIAEPSESFSTAEYKDRTTKCLHEILNRGKVPVLTGGTGLYIDALVKNIDFSIDKGNNELREELNIVLEDKGSEYLHAKLRKRDAEAADSVHPNNTRRVIRYLEILTNFEGSLEEYRTGTLAAPAEFNFHIFVLWPEREFAYNRIEERVDTMIENGLLDEVKALIEAGVKPEAQCMMGIGYKETYSYITGEITFNEFLELLKRNTRRYAKRQFTWFKRYKDATFITIDENSNAKHIADIINKSFKSGLKMVDN